MRNRTPRPIPKLMRSFYQFRRAYAAAKYGKKSEKYLELFKLNFLPVDKARAEAIKRNMNPLQKAIAAIRETMKKEEGK